jgi:hypothetical protein
MDILTLTYAIIAGLVAAVAFITYAHLENRRVRSILRMSEQRSQERSQERTQVQEENSKPKDPTNTWSLQNVHEEEQERQKTFESKKKSFLGGPWRFYYIDKDGINYLHNQMTQMLILRKIAEKETKKTGETTKSVGPEIPTANPSLETELFQKEKMQIPLETAETKYNVVLQTLIDKNLVIFDIEEFVYDKLLEKAFNDTVDRIEKDFEYPIPNRTELVNGFTRHNRSKQVKKKIGELKASIGKYVIIQGDCDVMKEPGSNGYLLSYVHPVSEGLEKKIAISALCTEGCMTRFGIETFARMAKINARIFGTITYFDESSGSLDISPITIH